MKFNTAVLHTVRPEDPNGATLPPIYQANAFQYDSAEQLEKVFNNKAAGFSYTRAGNPTVDAFERRIAALEGGIGAVACASGMSAVTAALLNILRAGDEVIVSTGLFGGTIDQFEDLEAFGIVPVFLESITYETVTHAVTPKTRAVFTEFIGNPRLDVTDIESVSKACKENGIPMRGHTLIWYSQTPSWLFYENYDVNGELASRELMLTRMENYIAAVMTWCEENYPGVIYAWDVVNEAIADDGGMRDCYWLETIGEDYVEKAFEFARKHAPEGVQLFYNDYNEYQDSKQADIIEMLKPVAEAGNIDGMGMQSHISSGLDPDYYLGAMQEYVDELGVIIHITELDVTAPNSQNPMYDQGVYMKKLFTAIIEAKDAGMPIECVTVWGLTDDMSWKSANSPLLFYGNLDPKPAYEGVMCAINGGEVTKPADYVEPKSDLSPIEEDYENKEYIGGPRYSAVQTIVGDAYEGEYCLMNSEGYADYDGYSIDISNYIGHTIHVSFAVKCAADQVCLTADIDGTWPHLVEVPTGTDEWIEVECDYQVPDDNTSLSIYFESSDMTEFYLDNLKIEAVD